MPKKILSINSLKGNDADIPFKKNKIKNLKFNLLESSTPYLFSIGDSKKLIMSKDLIIKNIFGECFSNKNFDFKISDIIIPKDANFLFFTPFRIEANGKISIIDSALNYKNEPTLKIKKTFSKKYNSRLNVIIVNDCPITTILYLGRY